MDKLHIVSEIKRTAEQNDGKPLGRSRFEQETGIRAYDWQRYWPKFGDAVREAGLRPNKFNRAYPDDYVFEKLVFLIRKLGKYPTSIELQMEGRNNPDFPSHGVFQKYGPQHVMAGLILEHIGSEDQAEDVFEICKNVVEANKNRRSANKTNKSTVLGTVYMAKSGSNYKIGRTIDTVRRANEIKIQLPERLELIHSIETDDPSGVEAYWHRRFSDKRTQGEWFKLTQQDIRAFKKWRRIS